MPTTNRFLVTDFTALLALSRAYFLNQGHFKGFQKVPSDISWLHLNSYFLGFMQDFEQEDRIFKGRSLSSRILS